MRIEYFIEMRNISIKLLTVKTLRLMLHMFKRALNKITWHLLKASSFELGLKSIVE